MLSDHTIDIGSLPSSILENTNRDKVILEPLAQRMKRLERDFIQKTVDHFGDTVVGKRKAAEVLGISLATLYNKINSGKSSE